MFHFCAHCEYKSHHKWLVRRHMNTKHKNDNHFEINPAQNQYHGPYYRAPTTISVGSDGGLAQTTGTVPHSSQHAYDVQAPTHQYEYGVQAATPHQLASNPQKYEYAEEVRTPRKVYDEDMDANEESDNEDEDDGEKDSDVTDILVDISRTFHYLQHLRKQYRDSLYQLEEFKGKELETFLEMYSEVKANIIEEQDGLEGTVFKAQCGKGADDVELEGETDEETVSDDDDDDDDDDVDMEDDDDTDEETVDSEQEETEDINDLQPEDIDVKYDKIKEDESSKEPFFNFVFEAENFLDSESKEKLVKYLVHDKKNLKLNNWCEQDESDVPQNADEVIEDIEHVLKMWNKKEEECFKRCSKKKILSVCNIAQSWMDATSLQKMKNINPSKYRFLKNMLKPHEKSLEKLANSKVSIHEKRKILQKPQVGEGILDSAANLVIPLIKQIF